MEEAAIWTDLPNDILYRISMQMDHLSDYIRFRAVCKSWRSAISDSPLHLRCPFLFLSSKTSSRDDHALYSPFERKVYPIKLPDRARKERCIGSSSSDGWVCMVDDNLEIYLFNPFSNAVVLLPPLRTDIIHDPRLNEHGSLEISDRFNGRYFRDAYTYKAVWSTEPTDPNCIILLVLQDAVLDSGEAFNSMAYCRPGNARWTMTKTSLNVIADAIFCKEDHRFYVAGYGYPWMSGHVVAIDILKEHKIDMPGLEKVIYMESDFDSCCRLHLAAGGSSGVVVVLRLLKKTNRENIPYRTVGFKLLKLDETETVWVETKSMDDDGGDGMVFLGLNNSMWLSSRDFKGFCKGNSVYFADDVRFHSMYFEGLCGESGVFHLEDGSFGSIYGEDLKRLYPSPLWVLPNP